MNLIELIYTYALHISSSGREYADEWLLDVTDFAIAKEIQAAVSNSGKFFMTVEENDTFKQVECTPAESYSFWFGD